MLPICWCEQELASVFFSEVSEVRDAVHRLTPRAINEEVGRELIEEMRWYDSYPAKGGADRSANPTPGNKSGGLANIDSYSQPPRQAISSAERSNSPP